MPTHKPGQAAIWAGLLVIYFVWGSTYLGIRVAVESIPPFTMAAMRFIPAALLLLAFVALRQRRFVRRPSAAELRDSLVVGTGLAFVGNGFVSWGEQTIPSGIAALLIALMPVWLAIIGHISFGKRLAAPALAGIAIGLGGVALLSWPGGSETGRLDPSGLVALLIAPLGWAAASAYAANRARLPNPPALALALQMLFGGLVLTAAALLTGEPARLRLEAVTGQAIVAVVYLMLVGSLFAWSVYAWLLRNAPLSLIGTYAYVNPIVAVILGAIVLGEPITPRTLVAGAIIVLAVALIVTARGRATQTAGAPPARARQEPAEAGS